MQEDINLLVASKFKGKSRNTNTNVQGTEKINKQSTNSNHNVWECDLDARGRAVFPAGPGIHPNELQAACPYPQCLNTFINRVVEKRKKLLAAALAQKNIAKSTASKNTSSNESNPEPEQVYGKFNPGVSGQNAKSNQNVQSNQNARGGSSKSNSLPQTGRETQTQNQNQSKHTISNQSKYTWGQQKQSNSNQQAGNMNNQTIKSGQKEGMSKNARKKQRKALLKAQGVSNSVNGGGNNGGGNNDDHAENVDANDVNNDNAANSNTNATNATAASSRKYFPVQNHPDWVWARSTGKGNQLAAGKVYYKNLKTSETRWEHPGNKGDSKPGNTNSSGAGVDGATTPPDDFDEDPFAAGGEGGNGDFHDSDGDGDFDGNGDFDGDGDPFGGFDDDGGNDDLNFGDGGDFEEGDDGENVADDLDDDCEDLDFLHKLCSGEEDDNHVDNLCGGGDMSGDQVGDMMDDDMMDGEMNGMMDDVDGEMDGMMDNNGNPFSGDDDDEDGDGGGNPFE
jgi:hypothetical protein